MVIHVSIHEMVRQILLDSSYLHIIILHAYLVLYLII
jgi:hypothetical protein